LDSELSQSMAAVVKSDNAFEPRADVLHLRDLGQKRRKLPDPAFERMNARQSLRLLIEQLGIVMRHHRGTGTRRGHDALGILERIEEVPGDRTGLCAESAVERRLSAAGLVLGKIELVTEPFEHLGHGHSDARE